MAETGFVSDVECVNISGPYELVNLGLAPNLGINYNSAAPAGLTGDHTTLATAYSGAVSIGFAPPNQVRPVRGVRVPAKVKTCFYYLIRVPLNATLTTGVAFELMLAMDPTTSSADLTGTKAYFDVVANTLNQTAAAGALGTGITPDDFILSTNTCVAAQTGTLPTAVGQLSMLVLSVPKANIGGTTTFAAGMWILARIRRLGDHQSDTNSGNVVLVAASAYCY